MAPKALYGLDLDDIISLSGSSDIDDHSSDRYYAPTHVTRQRKHGRAAATVLRYDQKYHPLDEAMFPARAAKRRRIAKKTSRRRALESEDECEADDSSSLPGDHGGEQDFEAGGAVAKRSLRRKSGKRVCYNMKVHPRRFCQS